MSIEKNSTDSMDDDNQKDVNILEDVPKVTDPLIQRFLGGRNGLIAQEKKRRSGLSSHAPRIFR